MGCGSSKTQVAPEEKPTKPECCIVGPPGSVKGRICELLEKPKDEGGLAMKHISLGEAQRTCVRKNDTLGPRVKEALQQKFNRDQEARKNGEKPDPANGLDPELNAQVLAWMFKEEAKEGWILEGYPRTKEEADTLRKQGILLDKLVIVSISDNDLVQLATGRRMDLTTNTMYHIDGLGGWSKPPEDEQVQARLVQRKDDSKEKVLARLSDYKETFLDVETFFQQSGVKKVDGRRVADDIATELVRWLEIEPAAAAEPVKEEQAPAVVADPVEDLETGGGGEADKDGEAGGGEGGQEGAGAAPESEPAAQKEGAGEEGEKEEVKEEDEAPKAEDGPEEAAEAAEKQREAGGEAEAAAGRGGGGEPPQEEAPEQKAEEREEAKEDEPPKQAEEAEDAKEEEKAEELPKHDAPPQEQEPPSGGDNPGKEPEAGAEEAPKPTEEEEAPKKEEEMEAPKKEEEEEAPKKEEEAPKKEEAAAAPEEQIDEDVPEEQIEDEVPEAAPAAEEKAEDAKDKEEPTGEGGGAEGGAPKGD